MEKTKPLLMLGNCLDRLKEVEENSIDAIVTDGPYGIKFMGKNWDYDLPSVEIWQECLRVLKPGGSLLAFASTRTQHRMAGNIISAGFELRDIVYWSYGSGFPKSLNIEKALIKMGNVPEETIEKWKGFGTSLKPAYEPISWAMKPPCPPPEDPNTKEPIFKYCAKAAKKDRNSGLSNYLTYKFPPSPKKPNIEYLNDLTNGLGVRWVMDDKHESLTVICPKDNLPNLLSTFKDSDEGEGMYNEENWGPLTNQHATVKPAELMRWLCKLVTPEGGTILDPFMGSGSTGVAALREGYNFVGVEMEPSYLEVAKLRTSNLTN